MSIDHPALAVEIHQGNVTAGWFTDIETGASIVTTRNRPEMLMLAVTELAEALLGSDGRPDDKLPHLPMYQVEVADFAIRVYDLIGCEVSCGHAMPEFGIEIDMVAAIVAAADEAGELMVLVGRVSTAMEHYRKRRMSEYLEALADCIGGAYALSDLRDFDLRAVIAEKRGFNAVREDHRLESRRADGGKKC